MLQLTFRHMDSSESLRATAEEQLQRLQHHHEGAIRCRVVLDCEGTTESRAPSEFTAHVDLSIDDEHAQAHATRSHEDAVCAMRDAFASAARQLVAHGRRRTA